MTDFFTCPRCSAGGITPEELDEFAKKHPVPGGSAILRYCARCAYGIIQIAENSAALRTRTPMKPAVEVLKSPSLFEKTPSLRSVVMANLDGLGLDPVEFAVAQMIYGVSGQPDRFITIREMIIAMPTLTERKVKDVVRNLRRTYLLPIIATRQPPYGYRVATSVDEFMTWSNQFEGQALDELRTLYQVKRKNWPELVGQGKIEFDLDAA